MTLKLGRHEFDDDATLMMAIVNRTPDSFYDKGATWAEDKAFDRVGEVVEQGAEIVDIGGIKAAPGEFIDEDEEKRRVVSFVERVRSAYPVEAADEYVVGCLEKQHVGMQPGVLDAFECGVQVGAEAAAAYVDDDGDAVDAAVGSLRQVGHRRDQCRRQVVDDEPAEVLQALRRGATAGPGHPGDDHQLGDGGLGALAGLWCRARTHLCSVSVVLGLVLGH